MDKIHYPIERQLIVIADRYNYNLPKDPEDMGEDELCEQEEIAARHVKWVKNDRYAQMVPVDLETSQIVE